MAKKPEGVDRETWLRERARAWGRRNMVLNVLMIVVVTLVVVRHCAG